MKSKYSRKRRFYKYLCSRSPRAEMHIKIYITPLRVTTQDHENNIASPQADIL